MRRSSLVALFGPLLPAAVLASASGALADIVIGQRIAGAKLGDTKAQVRKVLGPPEAAVKEAFFYPPSRGLRVDCKHGRLDTILSLSQKQKTTKRITIGSSRAQVTRAYGGGLASTATAHTAASSVQTELADPSG
jgi:hypothetical protein